MVLLQVFKVMTDEGEGFVKLVKRLVSHVKPSRE
jgi:hypothetical protein